MRNDYTDITIVLDQSGSMHGVAGDTIGGLNRFVKEQKEVPGRATLTLHLFNDRYVTRVRALDLKLVARLAEYDYVPGGNTALLDAIGRAIGETGKRLSEMPAGERPGKVVFVIITDGYENASREYTRERVFEMITHQREKYSWQFVFLGANQDAIQSGAGLGVSAAASMTYAANNVGTHCLWSSTADTLTKYRTGVTASVQYSDADRISQVKAGA
jgi:hypothetical protein